MDRTRKRRLAVIAIAGACLATTLGVLPWVVAPCNGRCYTVRQTVELGRGGYPRMAQVNDLLLTAYTNGSFVLDGVNLTSGVRVGPRVIIGPACDPARATLRYAPALDCLLCVFNHDAAAAIGIAWAPRARCLDPAAWTVQYHLVGPVTKEFFHVGLWEPYLAEFNATTFLLYFSNQTIFDPAAPLDATGYWYELEGHRVVQRVEVVWSTWNGTGFTARPCGAASADLPGGPVHYKDGMASSTRVGGNETHPEYLMTFEEFKPPAKSLHVALVRLRVSAAGVETLWRRTITTGFGGAPFITTSGTDASGPHVASFHHNGWDRDSIGFVGLARGTLASSTPVYLSEPVFGWPSVYTDARGRVWVAGTHTTTGRIVLLRLEFAFRW